MNIGLVYPNRDKANTGVRNYTKGVLQELLRIDKENDYYLSDDEYFNTNKKTQLSVKWGGNDADNLRYDFLCYCKKINIIHSYWNTIDLMKSKCKKIFTIYDIIPLIHPEWHTMREYFDGPVRRSASISDIIITDSEYTKSDVINYYNIPEERIKVVYPGRLPSLEKYAYDKQVKKKYNIKGRFILTVGTIEPRKNLRGLIKGFIRFKQSSNMPNDLKLVIVGNLGWDNDFMSDISKFEGLTSDIIITGFVTDNELASLYHDALAFAYVSYYEGFGMPLLEAMSEGKAVISSNTTSMPEVCEEAACYCDPYDVESIASSIERIASDDTYRLELEKLSVVQAKKFSFLNAANQIKDIYKLLEG